MGRNTFITNIKKNMHSLRTLSGGIMKNRFKNKIDNFFKMKCPVETFVVNRKNFDVIVKHWNPDNHEKREEVEKILGHKSNIWNLYIRFKPSFSGFDKLPDNYDDFNLIYFHGCATYFKMDGKNKVFGCDYAHFDDEDVMNGETFDENNRCFIDAHDILKQLEDICKGE